MNTHDKIELPPLPPGYTSYEFPDGGYDADEMRTYARAAIEADRKRRQSEAEEVCAEAYQVVGSLLSDLGIFETDHAKKILDNLSQAKMVHKDVLPWPSFDHKRRGEPVKVNAIFETENGEVIGTTVAKVKRVEWQDDGSLTVVIDYWPQPAEPVKVPADDQAQHEADRLEVFADSGELSDTLREMGAVARAKGRYMDAYYLDECAVHIKGLHQFAEEIVSARKS